MQDILLSPWLNVIGVLLEQPASEVRVLKDFK